MNKRSCSTCAFKGMFMNSEGVIGASICRRHPPTVMPAVVMTNKGPQTVFPTSWPEVDDRQWCGEWEADNAIVTQ